MKKVLVAAMVCAAVGLSAKAVDINNYSGLNSAINGSDSNIRVIGSFRATDTINTINRSINLYGSNTSSYHAIQMSRSGILTSDPVFIFNGAGNSSSIQYLTIYDASQSAIRNNQNLTISDSIIRNNTGGYGGGIYNGTTGTLNINSNTQISNNSAFGSSAAGRTVANGGGIYVAGGTVNVVANSGDISIDSNSAYSTNTLGTTGTASGYGGAIANGGRNADGGVVDAGGTLNISSVGGNISISGNFVRINPSASSSIDRTFAYGGAIYNAANTAITANSGTSININNNTISLERASEAVNMRGGAIYSSSNLSINANGGNISLSGNAANGGTDSSNSTQGGAIYNSGTTTISAGNGGNVTITNNKVTGSGTIQGGGIYNMGTLNLTTTDANSSILMSGNTAGSNGSDIHTYNGTINVNGSAGTVTLGSGVTADGTTYFNKSGDGTLILDAANNNFYGYYNQTGGILKITLNGTMFNQAGATRGNNVTGGEMQIVMTDGGGNWNKAVANFSGSSALAYLASTTTAINLDGVGGLMTTPAFTDATDLIFDTDMGTTKANYTLNNNISKPNLDRVIFRNSNVTLGTNTSFSKYGLIDSDLNINSSTSSVDTKTFNDLTVSNSTLSFGADFTDSGSGLELISDKLIVTNPTGGQDTIGLGTVNINIAGNNDNGKTFQYRTTVLDGLTFETYTGSQYVNSAVYRYMLGTDGTDITLSANAFADEYSLNAMNIKSGDRDFNFGVYGSTGTIDDYVVGANLDATAVGIFNVLGRNTNAQDSVIDANNKSLFNISGVTDLIVKDLTIQNAYISGNGSVLRMSNADATATFENVIIKNNTANSNGGAIYNNGGTLNIGLDGGNVTFEGNSADNYGGAIYNSGTGSTVSITDTTFTGNTAERGGAIYTYGETVDIAGTTFTDNTASSGGAIYTYGETVDIAGTTFTGNTANSNGGAIYNTSGTVTISDTTFTDNTANSNGGAIYNYYGTVDIAGTTFEGNTGNLYGGAIYNSGTGSTVSITDTTFTDNTANYGGAIYTNGGTVDIAGTTFTGNTASSGGAIFNSSGTVTISDTTFTDNTANSNGGAIYNQSGIIFSISDTTFTDNTASSGGAIYTNGGTVDIAGTTFTDNTASYGGAIFNEWGTVDIAGTTFEGNSADNSGGAIFNSNGTVTLSDTTFTGNTASDGGAICNRSGTLKIGLDGGNVTFEGNTAERGGAIFNQSGIIFSISDATFTDNTAQSGGAIYNYYAVLNIGLDGGDVTFEGNTAAQSGGAIYNTSGTDSTVNVDNTEFKQNKSTGTSVYDGGGAIYNTHGTLNVGLDGGNVTFEGNSADNYGGAIYNTYGTVDIAGTTFEGNTAQSGGAIYNANGTLNVTDATFSGNSATQLSGAIYNTSFGIVNLTSTTGDITFTGNTATVSGNDIYNTSTININGTANQVNMDGGIAGTVAGVINKSGAGEFNLLAGSINSGYVGTYNHSGGTTNVYSSFFGGTSNITDGELNLNTGSSVSSGTILAIGEHGTVNLNTDSNMTLTDNQIRNYEGVGGDLNKNGAGNLYVTGDNSGFTGVFTQTGGNTYVSEAGKIFSGTNNLESGLLHVIGSTIYYGVNVGSAGRWEHYGTTTSNSNISNSVINFTGNGASATFGAAQSLLDLGGKARYTLTESIDYTYNGSVNFKDSIVNLTAQNFNGGIVYGFKNSVIDLTSSGVINGGDPLANYVFTTLNTDNTRISFDINFGYDPGQGSYITTNTITTTNPGQTVGLDMVRVLNDHLDDGLHNPYRYQTLRGLEFNDDVNDYEMATTVWEYEVSVGENAVDHTKSDVILNAIRYSDEYTLDKMNMKSGQRGFNFSRFQAGTEPEVYHIGDDLNPMAEGYFVVQGVDSSDYSRSVLSGQLGKVVGRENNISEWELEDEYGSFFDIGDETEFHLKNLTITEAHKEGNGSVLHMHNEDAVANILNVLVKDNHSDGDGGAIYNEAGSLLMSDVVFDGNTATGSGGAVSNYDDSIMSNGGRALSFINNEAGTYGGAMVNSGSVQLIAADGEINFTGNKALAGAGGAIYNTGEVVIVSGTSAVEFSANSSGTGGGAIYNTGEITIVSGDSDVTFSENKAAGNGGAIFNTGTLALTTSNKDIIFSDNVSGYGSAGADANDIYNDGGEIIINGTVGSVKIGGGISGTGTITKSGAGILDLESGSDSSGYTGIFEQSGGLTKFAGKFFDGTSTITGGVLELATGGSLSENTLIELGYGAKFEMSANDDLTIDASQLVGYNDDFGLISKEGTGTLTLTGDFSNNESTFTQLAGKTIVGASDKFFGNPASSINNMLIGGELEITADSIYYGVYVGIMPMVSAKLTHKSNTTNTIDISNTNLNFLSSDSEMVFTNNGGANAVYNLLNAIDNGNHNTITFQNSTVKLAANDFSGGTQYVLNSSVLDLRNSLIQDKVFTDLNIDNSAGNKLSFDIALNANGPADTALTSDTLTITNPTNANQEVDVNNITLAADSDNGKNYSYKVKVLSGAEFSGSSDTTNVKSAVYNYIIGFDPTDMTKITLTANGFADEYSLNGQNIKPNTRYFDFGVYGSTGTIDDYVVGANLGATREGTFYVLGRNSNAEDSVIDANGKSLFNIASGTLTDLTVKDLTIQNANIIGSPAYGSVLRLSNTNSSALFDNVIVKNNASYQGGAIHTFGTLAIDGVIFTGNESAESGGAIYAGVGTITIDNTEFTDNMAGLHGGAIVSQGGQPTITINDTVFTGNSAVGYGGAIANFYGAVTINGGTTFTGNTASGEGGAIYNWSLLNLTSTTGDITFTDNKAGVEADGSGGYVNDIYNRSIININGTANAVNINGGFASNDASANINKSNAGIFNLGGDSSNYLGRFTQTGGTTNVTGIFFGGTNTISNGIVNFDDGSSLASTGTTAVNSTGVMNINHTDGESFTINGNVTGTGTINKTDEGTLYLTGNNSGFSGTFSQDDGTTIASGTLFNTTMNIKDGIMELTDGATLAGNTKLSINEDAVLNITNATGTIALNNTNLIGNNGTYGDINKTGAGTLNLSGDNSSYDGTFTQTDGTTVLESGTKLFGGNAANNLINGGMLEVKTATDADLNQTATFNGGDITYKSTTANVLTVSNSNLSNLVVATNGTTITFDAIAGNNSSKYQIAEAMNKGTDTIYEFKNSTITFSAEDYTGNATYSFVNSVLDLASHTGANVLGTIQNIEFDKLLVDSSTTLNIDVNFDKQPSSLVNVVADTVKNNGAAQTINLGLIDFHDHFDDGTQLTHEVDVLEGNLTFAGDKSVTYSTGVHEYLVEATEGGNSLTLTYLGESSINSLYNMNNLAEERVFSLSGRTESQYTYNIGKELGTTLAGDFTVAGKGADSSTISGAIVDSDGDLIGEYGSFFKVVQDDTTLKIQNITITDAIADGTDDSGNGSVLYQDSNSTTTFTNTVITGNQALNDGGAIYNAQGTVNIEGSGEFSNNNAFSGTGGAIYNNDILNIAAGAGQTITFENNTTEFLDNDIYNTSDGKININGAGTVNINSGIAGDGEIEKSNSGIFNINADSSAYTGKFTQAGGITNVSDSFFTGENIVDGGILNFLEDGYMADGSLEINDGVVNLYEDSYFDGIDVALNDGYLNFMDDSRATDTSFDIAGGTMNVTSDAVIDESSMNVSDGLVNVAGTLSDTDITQTGGVVDLYSGGSFDGGTIDISDGTLQFRDGSEFTDGTINQSGGTLNWAGTKLSDAELVVADGNLNVLNNSTLALNNSNDSIGGDAIIYLAAGSTISNTLGDVTFSDGDALNGALNNSSKVTFDDFAKDFSTGTGTYSQTTAGAELNLVNGAQVKTGANSTITNGTVNIGDNSSQDSLLIVGSGSTIGSPVNLNIFDGNALSVNGGSVTLDNLDSLNGTVALISGNLHLDNVTNNGVLAADGGNLYIDNGALDLGTGSYIAQSTNLNIAQNTQLNLNADSIAVIDNNDTWKGEVNLNDGKLILSNFTNSESDTDINKLNMAGGILSLQNGTNFTLGNNVAITNTPDVEILSAVFNIPANTNFAGFDTLTMNNGLLNTMNNELNTYTINTLDVGSASANFAVDIQGNPLDYDKFMIDNIVGTGNINISNFQILSAPIAKTVDMHIFQAQDYGDVTFTETAGTIHTGIYDYRLIPGTDGHYSLWRSGNNPSDLNRQAFRGSVATMAAYNNQLLINNMLFDHVYLDSNEISQVAKRQNQYAAIMPQFAPYQFSREDGTLWFKNYVSFERLSMTNNLNVGNNAYGTLVGADFPVVNLKQGWKFLPTAYISYNGGHQTFNGVSMYQNGGQGGFMGTFSKGDFIGSVLAYAGGYANEMSVAGVKDRTGNWFAGTATKAAYNFHPNRNLIIQPNILASYNAFGNQNWNTQFGGISMVSGMLNGINVAPGLNLIYGRESWSVYLTTQYMYYINDQISGKAGPVNLPSVSMRHGFIEYGVGATKTWKDRLSGYFQVALRNGGRTGVGFQFGLNWKL